MGVRLSHTRAVWLMVVVALLWSTAGVVTRHLDAARSFEVTFWRSLFTALSLMLILPLLRGRAVFATLRQGGWALWASGLCWGVMFTAFMVALTLTTVANVLVTMAIGPFFTACIAAVFLGYRIPMRTWLAIGGAWASAVSRPRWRWGKPGGARRTSCCGIGTQPWASSAHSHRSLRSRWTG
jgi:drug/metabolite transporter (DMT)-like permease